MKIGKVYDLEIKDPKDSTKTIRISGARTRKTLDMLESSVSFEKDVRGLRVFYIHSGK